MSAATLVVIVLSIVTVGGSLLCAWAMAKLLGDTGDPPTAARP
jgi:hypothetical protein